MSETTDVEKKSKPWQWPGEWLRDSTFYRDIATRTASGVLVLLVGYLAAVVLGYVRTPDGRTVIAVAGLALWPLLGFGLSIKLATKSYRKLLETAKYGRILSMQLVFICIAGPIAVGEIGLFYLFGDLGFIFNPLNP